MKEISAGKLVIKKSKFYAHLYHLTSSNEIDHIITDHKQKYSNANHHCYALIYQDESGNIEKNFNHDGEVGHPGKILLQLLECNDYTHHALVVSRIFGGVKLGVGGVSRAFRKAGKGTIILAKQK